MLQLNYFRLRRIVKKKGILSKNYIDNCFGKKAFTKVYKFFNVGIEILIFKYEVNLLSFVELFQFIHNHYDYPICLHDLYYFFYIFIIWTINLIKKL